MKHFVLHVKTIMEEKNMKKLLALLLAFVLVFSLFPVMAYARGGGGGGSHGGGGGSHGGGYPGGGYPGGGYPGGGYPGGGYPGGGYPGGGGGNYQPPVVPSLPLFPALPTPPNTNPDDTDPDPAPVEEKKEDPVVYIHDPNVHTFSGYGFDTKYHWLECACGCKISMERHVDPKSTTDDVCTCGYKFSDNADLSVLWIDGAFPINNFNKDVTEYEVKAHTYKEFKEAKISTFTYDSEATVEYPKDLTLKAGKNVFEIKVTAENQKVTKTYTVTVVK